MPTRILIADDNAVFRNALRKLLEGVDQWEVVEACDGQDAVSKSLDLRPNVILLDLAMPVKDGLTAAREISQLLPDAPILMCTMHATPHLELEAKKSGIRAVLSKSESTLLVPAVQLVIREQPLPHAPAPDPALPSAQPPVLAASSVPQPTGPDPAAVPALPSPVDGPKDVS